MKKKIFYILIGVLIGFSTKVVADTLINSNQVAYKPSDSNWSVENVDAAVTSLYDKINYGNATASDIKSGKTALVNGKPVTGNYTCPTCQTCPTCPRALSTIKLNLSAVTGWKGGSGSYYGTVTSVSTVCTLNISSTGSVSLSGCSANGAYTAESDKYGGYGFNTQISSSLNSAS